MQLLTTTLRTTHQHRNPYHEEVTAFGVGAFEDTKNLRSIVIPDSVKSCGHRLFKGSGLTTIVLPLNILTNIGISAFEDCNIQSIIVIPKYLNRLGRDAFKNCSSLRSISSIPDSVEFFDESGEYDPFEGCTHLKSISESFNVRVVDYFRASHQRRILRRVAVLTSLAVYQAMTEQTPPFPFPRFELLEGHLNGPACLS